MNQMRVNYDLLLTSPKEFILFLELLMRKQVLSDSFNHLFLVALELSDQYYYFKYVNGVITKLSPTELITERKRNSLRCMLECFIT